MPKPKKLPIGPPGSCDQVDEWCDRVDEWCDQVERELAPFGSPEWHDQVKKLSEEMSSLGSREWSDELEKTRAVIEELGRDKLIRRAVERGSPGSLCGLIQVLGLTSPEPVDLITAYAMLKYRDAGGADIEAYRRRAATAARGSRNLSKFSQRPAR
jgi:hypothetical protein